MSFPPPPSSGDSGRVSSPVTPDSSSDKSSSSLPVSPQIPKSDTGSLHEGTPVHKRQATAVSPQPQLNPVAKLTQEYQKKAELAAVESSKVEFLEKIPDLKELLNNPGTNPDSFPFDILFIDSSGKQISVLTELDGHPKADAIRQGLLRKLANIEQSVSTEKLQEMKTTRDAALHSFQTTRQSFSELNMPPPALNLPPLKLIIDGAIFTGGPSRVQQPQSPAARASQAPFFAMVPKKPFNPPIASEPPKSPTQPAIPELQPVATPVVEPKPSVKTPVELKLVEIPAANGSTFAPIFATNDDISERKSSGSIASVNSGTENLSLIGGGINQAFRESIHDHDKYQALHNSALEELKKSDSPFFYFDDNDLQDSPLQAMLAFVPKDKDSTEPSHKDGMGAVFIDVFRDNPPNGCEQNKAMIYVYPPKGDKFESKEAFLNAVAKTAEDILATANNYNKQAENDGKLPKLETVRMAAISSGLYCRSDCKEEEVQKAVKRGIEAYQNKVKDNSIKEIQLPPQLHDKPTS